MTKKYADTFLAGELIDLSHEIALLSPTDTPLYTLVAGKGQVVKANDITVTWRQKTLNNDRGTLKLEGAESGTAINSTRTLHSNLCQIMEKVTSVSGTVRALNGQDIGDEFLNEIQDRMIEMKRDCEHYFIQGVKTAESGATPRQMAGLLNLVDNVVDLGAKGSNVNKLEEDDFIDLLQTVWNTGANGEYYAFLNATEKRIVNNLLKNDTSSRLIISEGKNVMGVQVQRIETDFGVVNFVLDRHMPSEQILVVDLDLVEIAELRSAFYEDLAKTGDYNKGHVLVENTIKLLNTKAGGKLIGIKS